MDEKQFNQAKIELLKKLRNYISNPLDNDKLIIALIKIIEDYTFANRNLNKGRASRFVVDSLDLNSSICGEVIDFDKIIK